MSFDARALARRINRRRQVQSPTSTPPVQITPVMSRIRQANKPRIATVVPRVAAQ